MARSLLVSITQRALLVQIPPKYHELVMPSPISMSDAVLRALSLRERQVPRIPLILSSLETRILRLQAKGKLKSPTSLGS